MMFNWIQWVVLGFCAFSLWFCYKVAMEEYWESKAKKQIEEDVLVLGEEKNTLEEIK